MPRDTLRRGRERLRPGSKWRGGFAKVGFRRFGLVICVSITVAGCGSQPPAPVAHRSLSDGVFPSTPDRDYGSRDSLPPRRALLPKERSPVVEISPIPSTGTVRSPERPVIASVNRPDTAEEGLTKAPLPESDVPTALTLVKTQEGGAGEHVSHTGFIWPVSGSALKGIPKPGGGIVISGKNEELVLAVANGRVIFSGVGPPGYGNLVIVRHENELLSVYSHVRALRVKEGQTVLRRDPLAQLGAVQPGVPSLYFEVRKRGKSVDPTKFLPMR